MPRPKGYISKNVYVEVSDDLWAKVKIICFRRKCTLKTYVTKLLERAVCNTKEKL